MKFLLNVNITPLLGDLLVKKGHSYRHVAFIDKKKATDSEIIEIAKLTNEIIITHDLDYGALLSFSGNSLNAQIFYQLLMDNWKMIEKPLIEGAIIIIEHDKLRIRRLPIEKK